MWCVAKLQCKELNDTRAAWRYGDTRTGVPGMFLDRSQDRPHSSFFSVLQSLDMALEGDNHLVRGSFDLTRCL